MMELTNRVRALEFRFARLSSKPTGGTVAERTATYPNPTTAATRAALANARVRWYNTESGWVESYYAATGTAGLTVPGLVSGVAAGWYPVGPGPEIHLASSGSQAISTAIPYSGWDFNQGKSWRRGGAAGLVPATDRVTVKMPGMYDIESMVFFPNGTVTGVFQMASYSAANVLRDTQQKAIPLLTNYGQVIDWRFRDYLMNVDNYVRAENVTGTWTIGQTNSASTFLGLRYVGPALVKD